MLWTEGAPLQHFSGLASLGKENCLRFECESVLYVFKMALKLHQESGGTVKWLLCGTVSTQDL